MLLQRTSYLIAIFVLLNACGADDSPVVKDDYDRADSLSTEYTKEVAAIRGNIKEISQFYGTLKNMGAEFNGRFVNDPGKASDYSTTAKKCIGIGLYGADLNYLVINGQNDLAKSTIESISRLANELGIESAFDKSVFEKIVNEQDTVLIEEKSNLVSKAFRQAEDKMYNEERAIYATLMVAGGWVESMHLTSSILVDNNFENNLSDYWLLANNYNSILKMLELFAEDPNAKSMHELMEKVEPEVNAIVNESRIKLESVKKMKTAITQLRSKLI